jgi:hypothetical protein
MYGAMAGPVRGQLETRNGGSGLARQLKLELERTRGKDEPADTHDLYLLDVHLCDQHEASYLVRVGGNVKPLRRVDGLVVLQRRIRVVAGLHGEAAHGFEATPRLKSHVPQPPLRCLITDEARIRSPRPDSNRRQAPSKWGNAAATRWRSLGAC